MVKGDSDSEDEYHVAIDDGTRDKAWDCLTDGYLVSQGAAVTVSALTALISIHGSVHIASEASLAGLLPVVEGRLRELARRIDFNQY